MSTIDNGIKKWWRLGVGVSSAGKCIHVYNNHVYSVSFYLQF